MVNSGAILETVLTILRKAGKKPEGTTSKSSQYGVLSWGDGEVWELDRGVGRKTL